MNTQFEWGWRAEWNREGWQKRAPVFRLSLGPSENYASERGQTGSQQVKLQFWTIPSDFI